HVGQPRTAPRPRSTRLEPVQRLRSFNRRFLTYTFWPRLPDPHRLAVPARPVVVGAASRPPRRPPGRTALSFYRTAATARRWRSCTTTRSHRTSWRTHASLEDITLHLQLPDPLVLLTHLPAQPLRLGPLGLPHPTATATATGGCRMYGPVRGRRPVAPPPRHPAVQRARVDAELLGDLPGRPPGLDHDAHRTLTELGVVRRLLLGLSTLRGDGQRHR